MTGIRLLVAIVSLIALAIGAWLAFGITTRPAAPVSATVLPAPVELPPFELVDQAGERFTRADFEGHWNLVFFGFTHCPDVCPLTLQVLASARTELAAQGFAPLPRIVFVSVDPARDTPALVRDYVAYFDATAIGLTGTEVDVRELTDELGIFFQRAPGGGDNYLVDHSAAVLVIGPDARFRAVFGGPHEVGRYVADLPRIVGDT